MTRHRRPPTPRPRREGSLRELITTQTQARDAARALEAARREQAALAAQEAKLTGPPPVGRRGGYGPAAGRVGWLLRLPPLVSTSAQLCSVFPFVTDGGLPVDGPLVGTEVYSRSGFTFSLHELYRAKLLTAPNMVVTGRIGTAKSSLLKTLAFRGVPFGQRFYVTDIRSEYSALARLCGITPLRIGPGRGVVMNPLAGIRRDPGMPVPQWLQVQRSRRLLLLEGLLEIQLGGPLSEAERSLVEYAVDAVVRADDGTGPDRQGTPTLSLVLAAMGEPVRWQHRLRDLAYPLDTFIADSRRVRLALERLIRGALGGTFDGDDTTTFARLDFNQPGAVLDLADIRTSDQLTAMATTCAQSWLEAELSRPDAGARLCIYDEFALIARHLPLIRRMREQLKLARALGIGNALGFHRFSDLAAIGDGDSEAVRIARGLIEDSGVRISYGQEPGSLEAAREFLGATDTETNLLPLFRQGVALWKIGTRSYVVRHQLSSIEKAMVHTDSQMEALPDTDEHASDAESRIEAAFTGHVARPATTTRSAAVGADAGASVAVTSRRAE
ncbi:hypothetical protein GCM10022255_069290 [Dactylosporangium darangshiense]|uniref:ATP-binding protein n=1 Tax=Dactylosporangium darangshiense TaxID=579108 RepID=A0ABP8DHT5_9ACTN